MTAIVSANDLHLPRAWREQTGIRESDKLSIALSNGIILLQKIQPISEEQIQALVAQGRQLPPLTPADEEKIEEAIQKVRRRKHKK